ncbi:hypothetical protein BJY01DRAFT_255356 [Aspergillus pseudoustus]|uniref:GPI anchored protein n=1 Tax=Aspergillus pseudoustus TaxID=1810923 RepID=A0ABR4ILA1_9EURO
MHLVFTSLLAFAGLHLAAADPQPANARITAAPVPIPKLFRRQEAECPPGPYTMCDDGYGCCEIGAPCTTIDGEPACDTGECNGLPCGAAGLCCDALCTSSLGTPICVHTTPGFDDIDFTDTDDLTFSDFPSLTLDDETTSTDFSTASPTSDDEDDETLTLDDEDTTTAGPTSTPGFDFGDEDDIDDETATSEPTATGGSDSDINLDDLNDIINDAQDEITGEDGAGIVSPNGFMAVWVLAAIGGGMLLLR